MTDGKPKKDDIGSGTRLFTAGALRTVATAAVPAEQKYGKENYELLQKLVTLLDNGQKELLRKRYIDMLGIRHLSDTEQDKMLWSNRAYQKATADLEMQVDKHKRQIREMFDKVLVQFPHGVDHPSGEKPAAAPEPGDSAAMSERQKLRRERLARLRIAQAHKAKKIVEEYNHKKKLYDAKFETVENDAYVKGMARAEDDRKRYEQLSQELEVRMKSEQEAIGAAQKALEDIETTRTEAHAELENTRRIEREIKQRVKDMLGLLKSALPSLEELTERLALDVPDDPALTTRRGRQPTTRALPRPRSRPPAEGDPATSTSKGLKPPKI